MTKGELIREIKKYCDSTGKPYSHINVLGGRVTLEQAPQANLFYMYKRITGTKKKEVMVVVNPAKPVSTEKQLEFTFV